jgi:hypothetical protein
VRASRPSLLPSRLRLQGAGEREVERHATWTELFFDLVFVVCVAQLAAGLHDRPSLAGAATFAGLFVGAAPRGLERPAVAGRCALAVGAVLLASLGDHLSVVALVGLPALALCVQPALETVSVGRGP